MKLLDLTLPLQSHQNGHPTATPRRLHLGEGDATYTAIVYDMAHDSMAGTYLDLPGHIEETDDGQDAATLPVERLYRLPAAVVHLDRQDGSGGIGAAELAAASEIDGNPQALIINALGARRFDEIQERSVYLELDAIDWIITTGVKLLVSDVYESRALHGVFKALFGAGISTVCCPINLHQVKAPTVRLTVLPARIPQVTQLPCRVVAELP